MLSAYYQDLGRWAIEWSGEFEHQVRAARTLRFVFPAAISDLFLPVRFYWVRRARWLKLHSHQHHADDLPNEVSATVTA